METAIRKATHPGSCYLCGSPIYTGDKIVTSTFDSTPVAAHADCVEKELGDRPNRDSWQPRRWN